jgi:hypothetical protein
LRNINLAAIHPTVKTVGFLAERSVKCFIKEYQPLFDRLSGTKLLTPAQEV